MILVIGSTGLVGSHLLLKLVQNNDKVRAIYRRAHKKETVKHVFSYYINNYEALFEKIEWLEADITDIPELQEAFENVTHVYHCAAFVSFEPDKYRTLRKINIEGTANIVNICLSKNVKKLCYVSSIAAIGKNNNPENLITEETKWNSEEDNSVYAITKYGAEIEVWRGTQEGLDAVIVNPGIILGPGYWRSGGSGSLFYKIYKGLNYYTSGSSGYVDILDVTSAMHQLMESSIVNENFILVGDNLSFRDFNIKTAEALGISKPQKLIKPWQLNLFWRFDWLSHKLLGKRRKLSKQLAKSLTMISKYDNSKIIEALNFEFTPIEASIKRTSEFLLRDLKK